MFSVEKSDIKDAFIAGECITIYNQSYIKSSPVCLVLNHLDKLSIIASLPDHIKS
jgi:hypothetical protein